MMQKQRARHDIVTAGDVSVYGVKLKEPHIGASSVGSLSCKFHGCRANVTGLHVKHQSVAASHSPDANRNVAGSACDVKNSQTLSGQLARQIPDGGPDDSNGAADQVDSFQPSQCIAMQPCVQDRLIHDLWL
jgi:hypothetical protein